MVSFSKSSQEGSSRNAVEEPTGRDDLSSQEGSSRNAVEEPTGRGDIQKCPEQSSLRDEKFIQQISQKELSRDTLEKPSGRVKTNHRDSLTGNSSMRGLFTVQLKPSVFRARSKALLLMLLFGGSCVATNGGLGYMTKAEARAFIKTLPDLVSQAQKANPRLGNLEHFKMEHIHSDMAHKPDKFFEEESDLDWYYKHKGARSCFETDIESGRMKWNYTLYAGSGKFTGFSPEYSKNDLQVYSRKVGEGDSRQCAVFTAVHSRHLYIVVPFTTERNVNLHVFSTKRFLYPRPRYQDSLWQYEWVYEQVEKPESPEEKKFLAEVKDNMETAWKTDVNAQPQQKRRRSPQPPAEQYRGYSGQRSIHGDRRGNSGDQYRPVWDGPPGVTPPQYGYGAETDARDDYRPEFAHQQHARNPNASACGSWIQTDPSEAKRVVARELKRIQRERLQTGWDNKVIGWVHENCQQGEFVFSKTRDYVWLPHNEPLQSILGRYPEAVQASISIIGSKCKCGLAMPKTNSIQTIAKLKRGIVRYRTRSA